MGENLRAEVELMNINDICIPRIHRSSSVHSEIRINGETSINVTGTNLQTETG